MMLLGILLAQLAAPGTAKVDYRDVRPEVVSASVYEWSDLKAPSRVTSVAVQSRQPLSLTGTPGMRAVVVFTRSDGQYLIDGPFVWPDRDTARRPDPLWRHTVAGARPLGLRTTSPLAWVSNVNDSWPQCRWTGGDRWECWGIPDDGAGIAVAPDDGRLWWCTVQRAAVGEWHTSEWGRLIVIGGPEQSPPANLKVELQRPVAPPAYRFNTIRLETGPVPSITATLLGGDAVWVAGARPPDKSWLGIRAGGAAPAFVSLADLAAGTAPIPERLTLDPARRLEGTVAGGTLIAAHATITLFRLIDPPPGPDGRLKARRVFEAETTADDRGGFAFDAIGNGDHELVAWHPQLGHASVLLQPGQRTVAVRLDSAGIARGRVLVDGKPAAGVDVFSVPDAKAFADADDPVDVKGGDARTAADGRFVVSLAPRGGGELRIGGGDVAIKRLPLPPTPLPLVDLGDIELAVTVTINVVLDGDSSCDLVATGPIGHLGLQVVTAVRTGPGVFRIGLAEEGQWEFGLDCAGTIRALTPAIVTVTRAMKGKEVQLSVPRARSRRARIR